MAGTPVSMNAISEMFEKLVNDLPSLSDDTDTDETAAPTAITVPPIFLRDPATDLGLSRFIQLFL